jgi:hypothetical protein
MAFWVLIMAVLVSKLLIVKKVGALAGVVPVVRIVNVASGI